MLSQGQRCGLPGHTRQPQIPPSTQWSARPTLPARRFRIPRLCGASTCEASGGCSPTLEVEPSPQASNQPATHHSFQARKALPQTAWVSLACLAASVADFAAPLSAHASEGSLTGQSMEVFTKFLEQVESMGPAGGVLFVVVVMLFEMVPLFPTQPLSLASGLLFGAQKGAVLMLIGVTLAATNAYLISRGVGRTLAQKVIDAEVDHADAKEKGAIAKTLKDVQAAIDGGGIVQQMTAVTLLRLTPVVPFSASNYLLGLTPLQLPAYLGGTIIGMSLWSVLYASLGGASRALLDNGGDMEQLFQELADQAAAMSSNALGVTAAAVGAIAAVFAVRAVMQQQQQQQPEQPQEEGAGHRGGVISGKDGGEEDPGANTHTSNRHQWISPSSNGRGGVGEKEAVKSMVGQGLPRHRRVRD